MPKRKKRNYSAVDRVRYAFDRVVSAGTFTHILLLALLTLAIILPATAVVIQLKLGQAGMQPYNEREALWWAFEHAIDTGAIQNDQGWPIRLVMLAVTFGGMMVVSLLIGVLTAGIDRRLTELRKGRSKVVEADHTLILGWNPTIFTIVRELALAAENKSRSRVVVLAPRDKVEMEDELRARVPHTGHTRVICRSGDPIDPDDLAIVNPFDAKAIVVLGPEVGDPDAHVIKALLALTADPRRGDARYHIVAEIRTPSNLEAAQLVGRAEAQLVSSGDLVSRVITQTSLVSGSAAVYQDLLDFKGSELYFFELPELVGSTFRDAALRITRGCLVGLLRRDGVIALAPAPDTRLAPGEQVIVVARDDDPIKPLPRVPELVVAPRGRHPARPAPQRTLVLGWNRHGASTLRELDAALPDGSSISVVADLEERAMRDARASITARRATIHLQGGDTTSRPYLEALDVSRFQHVIILGYTDLLDAHEADARTLVTLLHLRALIEASGQPITLVSEMIDTRNCDLARVARVDDFIVSDQLVSLMLTQMAENPHRHMIFTELLGQGGCYLGIRPVEEYVEPHVRTDFTQVMAAALAHGEAAFGYRRAAFAGLPEAQYGVTINPERDHPLVFEPGDQVLTFTRFV